MIIKNLLHFLNGRWQAVHILIDPATKQYRILQQEELGQHTDSAVVDFSGRYFLLPGLYDSHIHGIGGHDFSEGNQAAYEAITTKLGEVGVAYCSATFVSMELDKLKNALAELENFLQGESVPGRAKIISVHLEGPFIAKDCKGAHDESILQDRIDLEIFLDIIKQAPSVTDWKITLDPALPGALEFIKNTRSLKIDGKNIAVHVFLGHSNAAIPHLEQAQESGISGYTHLGNACGETAHRGHPHPQLPEDAKSHLVQFALSEGQSTPVELIVDGEHLSEAFIAAVYQRLPQGIILITDALSPAGMPDGEYQLGSLKVLKQGNKIVLKDNPTKLAGSCATLPELVKNFMAILKNLNLSDEEILKAVYYATITNPRQSSVQNPALLNDTNNYTIFDRKTGDMVMSVNEGIIVFSKEIKPSSHNANRNRFDFSPKNDRDLLSSSKLSTQCL